ncbi:tetratricopeptide repeat protein [Candidatus Uhrbacteria bacterium]|nr:tetratricopeptide repeat protein [Candidatus Uhrbacteria bacterium]
MGKGVYVLSAARVQLMILIFFIPLMVFPLTLDPVELHKQNLLVIFTAVAALCWLASMFLSKELTLRRGWINLLPWLLGLAFLVPAWFSSAPYLSWLGAHRQEYTSALTAVALAILFYLIANIFIQRQDHQRVHVVLLGSASLVACIAVLEVLGVPLVTSLVPSLTLNTVGTLGSCATFLVVLNAFFLAAYVSHRPGDSLLHDGQLGVLERILIFFVMMATVFLLLVLDDSTLWGLFIVSLSTLFLFILFRAKDFPHHGRLILLLVLLLGSFGCLFFSPGFTLFPVPLEVMPSASNSNQIAQSTLDTFSRNWGSGPGTYQFDYSQFHDAAVNATDFWNTRFDRASSFVLTLLPTIGRVGVSLLGLFVGLLFIRAIAQVLRPASKERWLESFIHLVPWVTLVVSTFLMPWNMTLVVAFGVFSGLLASQVMASHWSKSLARSPVAWLSISTVMVGFSLAFLIGIFLSSERMAAEMLFARAIERDRSGEDLQEVVELLDQASRLNTHHDTYYRNLGEALLLRLDEELEGVSSIDTLTPESTQYIQSLTAASVNAVAHATDLSPNNSLNWLSRGFVYRELISVLGEAGEYAVSSYTRAVELEPVNPQNWTELGKAYMAASEQVRLLTASSDAQIAAEAQRKLETLLLNAQSTFERAVELKPNYAPAHYQLAVVYERQGRMDDAVGKMESVAQYNQLDVGVFFQLGMLYLQRGAAGDQNLAKTAFEHAVKLVPDYANAHWFLASIFEAQGDIAAAVREIETVLEQSPDNEIVRSRLDRLLHGQITNEVPEVIEE